MNTYRKQSGFNLVELMIAMIVGLFLIAGALRIYTQSQTAIQVNDAIARMQETARFAIGVIEKDIRAAELWGRTNDPLAVGGRGLPTDPDIYGVTSRCTANWSVNLTTAIEGSNNVNPYPGTCIPTAEYRAGSDVLVLRHADETDVATADLRPGVMYIRSNSSSGLIFTGTAEPASLSVDSVNNELVSVAYWVSSQSDADPTIPSLRRSILSTAGGAPAIVNEEVIAGVEDLQVQYGVDTTGDDSVNMYLDFDDVVDPNAILVARVWVRVRSENVELGFEDDATFIYADGSFNAADVAAASTGPTNIESYRRMLVTKTVELRNRRAAQLVVGAAGP